MIAERRVTAAGFTLIEVLVALAIVAFGLIAVFGQLSQSATAAVRLRDKTIAHWIAMNILTERRLLQQLPGPGTESDDIEMANMRWHYVITYSETGVEGMRRADVTVAFADDGEHPVATATGFLAGHAPLSGPGQGNGWPLIAPQASPSAPPGAPAPAGERQ